MENEGILLGDTANSEKMDLKRTSVWRATRQEFHWKLREVCESNAYGIPMENEGILLGDSANSKNMDLKRTS
eukprot:122027-Karenia_brevis.AAC.1